MATPGFTFSPDVAPICEVGMSDVAQPEPDTWVDVSCYVHEAELVRGRERFSDRFQPGTATVTFSNDSGWADLVGDYAAVELIVLRPGRPIRVGVIGPFDGGPVVTRWLWRGFIDQATPAYDPVLHDVVTVNCIDAFGEAGMRQLVGNSPPVGVNDPVHTRINRVLDAREWWTAKRSIATGTALMQGSALQGGVSDLLTLPADSAGGVIFGDTNGNVVYRDIGWELYDPDVPPDGEIGNCDPGTPASPGEPPYQDPTQGPVIDVDPPPVEHPTVTHFCVGQTDDPAQASGVIIERGEAYTIFVAKPPGVPEGGTFQPHLYLTENGHTWDLGEWPVEGGCTTITHPTTVEPPTRIDDPKPGEPPPVEIPGIPVPTEDLFGVELLGYSDGALADPPADTVTVTGITPGPGRLLIVLICALGNAIPAGSLTPFPVAGGSITGGDVTFDEIGREPSGGNGAESYGAAGRTGRIDPGTFDVVVDWAGTNQSREHIVTVWGVTAERPDLLDRMKLGAYLRAFTWDRVGGIEPSPINPPGKGPFTLPFDVVPPYPRLHDITIGQSLAESPTGPFGASFDDTDGPWTVPPLTPTVLADVAWVDDFDRADGDLGPNWVTGPRIGWIEDVTPFTIQSGAAVGTVGATDSTNLMHWAVAQTDPNQSIEVEYDAGVWGPLGTPIYQQLYTNMTDDPVSAAAQVADFTCYSDAGTIEVGVFRFNAVPFPGDSTSGAVATVAHTPNVPVRVRLESDGDGTQRLYIDNELALTYVDPAPVTGPYVGMSLAYHASDTSPRILRAGSILENRRRCSWVAGWRENSTAADAKWLEVNAGPDDIQSCQACVVVEPLAPDQFGWRTLGYYAQGPAPFESAVPPMSHASTVRYERNSVVLVFVSAFAAGTAGIVVSSSHGLTFHEAVAQGPVAPSHGQGAVFWAKTPDLAAAADDPDVVTVTWTTPLDAVNYLIEEVTNGDTVAATGSNVYGIHSPGSVDGAVTASLSAAPATNSLTFGFLGTHGDLNPAGAIAGVGWTEEINYLPAGEYTFLHGQTRVGSTDPTVSWVDANADDPDTGAQMSDAVILAVEVTPGPDYVNWETEGPLVIGGAGNAFNGPIYSAEDRNADGSIIWQFNPGDYV